MITNPMSGEHYDETDYNPEPIEFIRWRERVTALAKDVGKAVGFEDVVINVFGTWGYTHGIGTVRVWINGCESFHYWNDATVARFQDEDPEMLLRELLPQLVASATKKTKQAEEKKAQEKAQERIKTETEAALLAAKKAASFQKIEEYKTLSPEQIKASWAAKLAAAKAAQEAEARKPKLRRS